MWSDALFHLIDPKSSSVVGKVGFVPLPTDKMGRVAQIASSYFVSRYSKHPVASFEFILWMTRRDNQIKQELARSASARKSVYDEPTVLKTHVRQFDAPHPWRSRRSRVLFVVTEYFSLESGCWMRYANYLDKKLGCAGLIHGLSWQLTPCLFRARH